MLHAADNADLNHVREWVHMLLFFKPYFLFWGPFDCHYHDIHMEMFVNMTRLLSNKEARVSDYDDGGDDTGRTRQTMASSKPVNKKRPTQLRWN